MDTKIHLKSLYFKNSLGKFKIYKNRDIYCYSKKQVHYIYPKNTYKVIGEYKNKNLKNPQGCIGDINVDDIALPFNKYKNNNRIIYKEEGYLKCDEDSFIVLLKNVFIKRILAFVLCIFLIYAICYESLNSNTGAANNLCLDSAVSSCNSNEPPEDTSKSSTTIPGISSLNIPKDATSIKVSLENPPENHCYFLISLHLDDGTELFKSDLISPGEGLYNVTLSKSIPAGKYNAVLRYQTFSLDNKSELNGADLNIMLISN